MVTAGTDIQKTVIRRWQLNAFIEAREEWWTMAAISNEPTRITACYNMADDYIGDVSFAKYLIAQTIRPEKIDGSHRVCSVGYSRVKNMWAGWSHRALAFFGIGDRIFQEGYGDDNTPFVEHGPVVIASMDQARQAAVNFAEYVS